jgi:hypothetical protein
MRKNTNKPYSISKYLPASIFCLALMVYMPGFTQQTLLWTGGARIKGRLYDSAQKKGCANAVTALLSKDSSLLRFSRSQKDGKFAFDNLGPGTYIILFTHPSYNEYSFAMTIGDGEEKDLGNLEVPPRSDLLTAVVVTPKTANPHMKGDTLEYNTGNMRLQPNASVEELLKRLPGVQVDRNGVITINGQKIDRLLVDGKDFFTGDPTLVTRNFNADMIAKVQVLNKKSKKAEFTGIDDGQKTRTINLSLKNDSKRGYFTNGQAGHDPDDHYRINGLLGGFKDKRQFAVIAMSSNEGSNGAEDASGQSQAGILFRVAAVDPLGASAGIGIPNILMGGTHYANQWLENDMRLSGNYQYGRLRTAPTTSSIVIQTLPDTIYTQSQTAHSQNTQEQHNFSSEFQISSDSLNTFQLIFKGNQLRGNNIFNSMGSSMFNDSQINSSQRHILSESRNETFDASLMWNKKSHVNPQRFFSFAGGINGQNNTTNGLLYSLNRYYRQDGNIDHADSVDQRKIINTHDISLHADVGYGAPLWKNASYTLGYGISLNKSQSIFNTWEKNHDTYDIYIDSLSDHYRNSIFMQSFTIGVLGGVKKWNYAVNSGISHSINVR